LASRMRLGPHGVLNWGCGLRSEYIVHKAGLESSHSGKEMR
jgi:hypothetical protein